jgi:hypothetical protein
MLKNTIEFHSVYFVVINISRQENESIINGEGVKNVFFQH